MDGLHTFFPQLNPILSFSNYYQAVLADFLSIGGSATNYKIDPPIDGAPLDALSQFGMINQRSVSGFDTTVPSYDRGNAYLSPNAYDRATKFGVIESLTCARTASRRTRTRERTTLPCYVQPPLLFDNKHFPQLQEGVAPVKPAPGPYDGSTPARP